ncbi:type II toxin-antitoxin system YafO family toxin [Photorhabdus sp. RM71S]|uniref:type II toxin-antitoxin system YafO family toxin n=1 Tax=Photorhabdus sp. RM71S TaxID=3342824 RepID=UPI0036DD98A9
MPKVTITPKYVDNAIHQKYASMLSKALDGSGLSGYIGKFADFRNSAIARQSFIEKVHIRVPGEKMWDEHIRQSARVSDSFLVFCKH